jgi:hypothetical protein
VEFGWDIPVVCEHLVSGHVEELSGPLCRATMETENAEPEEQEFSQVMATRQTEPEHNVTVGEG